MPDDGFLFFDPNDSSVRVIRRIRSPRTEGTSSLVRKNVTVEHPALERNNVISLQAARRRKQDMHADARCGLNVFMAGAMTVLVAVPVGVALGIKGWRLLRDAVR